MKTTINLRIDSKRKEQLETIALELDIPVSALVREILVDYIEGSDYFESDFPVIEKSNNDYSRYTMYVNGKLVKYDR